MTADDAIVANKIWGPDLSSLKGKTTRKIPPTVPTDIAECDSINVFFVNKVPFFLMLSQKIMFSTVTHLTNRKISMIYAALKLILM